MQQLMVMNTNSRKQVLLLGVVVFGFVILVASSERSDESAEPRHAGKSLSNWLRDLDIYTQYQTDPQVKAAIHETGTESVPTLLKQIHAQAKEAIRELGTNALPYLLEQMRKDLRNPNVDPTLTKEEHLSGVRKAFEVLGPEAKPAVPKLIQIMNVGGIGSCSAATALTFIGGLEVAAALAEALTNQAVDIRCCIAASVARLGTEAEIVVPQLVECTRHDDKLRRAESLTLRGLSTAALGRIGRRPALAVPALIERLDDEHPWVRFEAARALGKFGKEAQSALAALRRVSIDDPQYHVRDVAKASIEQIEGAQSP